MSSVLRKRFTSLLIPTLVLAVLVHEFLTTPIYTNRELDSMRESAVALARQGDVETALEQLRALSEVAPTNRAIWGDYLTELVRAGRDADALTLYRRDSKKPLPDYALAELFDAAVRQRDVALARELADREIAQSANREAVAAAREQALLAAGLIPTPQPSEAVVAATTVMDEVSAKSQSLSQKKSPQENQQPEIQTQKNNSRRIENRPGFRLPVTVPRSEPQVALIKSSDSADKSSASVELAERARNAIHRAEQAPAAERIEAAQQALSVVDEYVASLPSDSAGLLNANLDRVRVLTLANRLDEAAQLFDSLGDVHTLPTFGLFNGADLFARRHESARADALIDIILQREPDNRAALRARFYAQIERGDRIAAATTLERLQQTATNDEERRADRLLAVTLAIESNDLSKAQRQLEELRVEQPAAADVRERLGQIYRWRGWPRRALTEYSQAEQNGGVSPDLHLAKAAALSDAHDFVAARSEIEAAEKIAPDHSGLADAKVQQLNRSRWEYEVRALVGRSPDSTVNTEGDRRFEQKLWSPMLDDRVRVFAHHRYDWADFPYEEGDVSVDRRGIGAAFYSTLLDASMELYRRRPGGELGMNLNENWHLDDRWSLFAEFQSDTELLPLRAINDDQEIDGRSFSVGAVFSWDNDRNLRAVVSRAEFDETVNRDREEVLNNNERHTFLIQYRQNLLREKNIELNLTAQAYHGRNSGGEYVAYFNPSEENSLGGMLDVGSSLWVTNAVVFSHRIALGAGVYRQQDFSAKPIWDVEYEQRWRLSDELDFNYGLMHRSRVYDGESESYNAIFGGVNWRF